jgi:hypothetical protein
VDRVVLRFDGFFGDSVGGVPYGGDSVRGPSLTLWAVGRGSTFEAGIIVEAGIVASPSVSEKVRSEVSFREAGLAEVW